MHAVLGIPHHVGAWFWCHRARAFVDQQLHRPNTRFLFDHNSIVIEFKLHDLADVKIIIAEKRVVRLKAEKSY